MFKDFRNEIECDTDEDTVKAEKVIPIEYLTIQEVEIDTLSDEMTIPALKFVSNKDVVVLKEVESNTAINTTNKSPPTIYKCSVCGKLYKQEISYVKHKSKCKVFTTSDNILQ